MCLLTFATRVFFRKAVPGKYLYIFIVLASIPYVL